MVKLDKDFRDKFMVADRAEIFAKLNGDACMISFVKIAKIAGFGTTEARQDYRIPFTGNGADKNISLEIPKSVLNSIFYASSYGDSIAVAVEKVEEDRHLYLVKVILHREYKGKDTPLLLTLPLGVVRGK